MIEIYLIRIDKNKGYTEKELTIFLPQIPAVNSNIKINTENVGEEWVKVEVVDYYLNLDNKFEKAIIYFKGEE